MSIFKYVYYSIYSLIWTGSIYTQELIFPDDYTGQWKGELEIFEGNHIINKLHMEVHILSSQNIDTFYYTLKYINDQVIDQRDYLLIKDHHTPQLIRIDEQNGIILEMEQFGNKWVSVFRINDSQIHFHYTVNEDQLFIEVFSIAQKDIRKTGGINDTPIIGILKNSVYQRAVLVKK